MSMRVRSALALLLLSTSLVSTTAQTAFAEPSAAAVEEGRARFTKGVSLFRAGDFRAALIEFNRANTVAPSFRIQFNIGQTCAELQDHVCAMKAFSSFLNEGGKQVPAAQRTIAEKELTRLKALVGTVRIVVDVDGANVTIDDTAAGASPIADPMMVIAGKRKITAKKSGLTPVSATVDVPAGETVEVSLAFAETKNQPPGVVVTTPSETSRTPFYIGLAATGVLTAGTVVFGALSLGANSDLKAKAGELGTTKGEVESAQSKVKTLAIVTDVFFGATLVAAGVTTYLFFKTKPQSTQVGIGPGSVLLTHNF